METTQQRHAKRIQRVIDHIHDHSADDLDSAAVAEVAQLSAYHWHRIYVAVTGESAVSTLRRVRLQKSATALLRDDRPIAHIASECGFYNLQAYTRLFSRTYGVPPGKFRSSRGRASHTSSDQMLQQGGISEADVDCASASGTVEIARRDSLRLVGLWHVGDYHEIGRVFEKVMAAAEIESWPRSEPYTVGIYLNDPNIVPIANCRSFAGIPVRPDFRSPPGYDSQGVSGGLHATCLHRGPHALLEDSYRWMYRKWLTESDHDARNSPCHEIYLNTPYDTQPSALETLVCLPLEGDLHEG